MVLIFGDLSFFRMYSVGVLGDLFVRRLGDHAGKTIGGIPAEFVGIGGICSDGLTDFHLDAVTKYTPKTVFLHVGGNDLDGAGRRPEDVLQSIISLTKSLTDRHVARVVVGEVTARDLGVSTLIFDSDRRRLNSLLRRHFGRDYIFMKGISFPRDFRRDGVHFNLRGTKRYYRLVLKAVSY